MKLDPQQEAQKVLSILWKERPFPVDPLPFASP